MRTSFASLSLTTLAALPAVIADVTELWWNITYVQNASPDGLYQRRVIGVNGTFPPPPIDVTVNDTLIVHATNSLDVPTTLHHHGMFFNSTSWMDGARGVSQCGVPPGASFTYVVPINESDQWGTYWVHSHSAGQYADGLRSPVVIHPTKEVHSYDEEYTVILSDWYHKEHDVLLKEFISVANPGGAEPVPDSALIYFAQNGTYLGPKSGTSPDPVTASVGYNDNATLPFEPGKTYRLRVVNVSAFAAFFFWIDGHDMRIIEVDGTDVEESPIDLLSLTVAQRYSVLVTARNDTSSNWAIHGAMDTDMFDTVPAALNPNVTSSITYDSSASTKDLGGVDAFHDTNDTALVPVEVQAQLPPANKKIELEVSFDTMDDGTNHAMFNGITWNAGLVPTVLSAATLGSNATIADAYGPLAFVVDHLDVVDIVVKNSDAGKHPFHLHGHKYQIIGRAQDYTSDNVTLNPPVEEGQANPIRRDTVQVPSMNSVTLRLVADNPGTWLFHCHIEWHLEVGLAMQLIEAPLEMQKQISSGQYTIPTELADQCAAMGQLTSGNAAGHTDPTDLSGLTLGPYPQNNGWHPKGIGAMFACVFTATLGMVTVAWYAIGSISDEEVEREVRAAVEKKEARGRFGRFFPKKA